MKAVLVVGMLGLFAIFVLPMLVKLGLIMIAIGVGCGGGMLAAYVLR